MVLGNHQWLKIAYDFSTKLSVEIQEIKDKSVFKEIGDKRGKVRLKIGLNFRFLAVENVILGKGGRDTLRVSEF
ncbi:hypothetical protein BKG92_03525 [Rodentibacter ratti]|uniref:Uncharacterized protein n=1 Tax=Rodentibacter ratti TaxID=1906745 RepID=A0A1V3L0A8_9PAST|nr:hypothetical protein BKG92_03525 [Rodentibacter ratti]